MADSLPENAYRDLLGHVAEEIRHAQARLVRRTNATVIEMYWRIGTAILARQVDERYGSRVVERLSADLAAAFPGQRGFSPWNLRYMRAFAAAWPNEEILHTGVQNLPWVHIKLLLDRFDDTPTREWYARRAIDRGWTHGVLLDRINAQPHLREGAAPSNIPSDPAGQPVLDGLATDPYRLDFIRLEPAASERDLKSAVVDQITEFLQHLGRGFAYMGRQYVTAIERQVRRDGDDPTIGVLLVPDKNRLVVEYTLAAVTTPMAVASYTYTELPPDLQATLPGAEDLAPLLHAANEDASQHEL